MTIGRQARMSGWRARLSLTYAHQAGRTRLTGRRHIGPLLVQKSLYPEGDSVCHTLVLHPPAGIVGGDRLALDIRLGPGSQALLTTPGAGKWYTSHGPMARLRQDFRLGSTSILEWLPQETLVFNGAQARQTTQIQLQTGAVFCGWDILCLGRRACNETFTQGNWRSRLVIACEDRLIYNEHMALHGSDPRLTSPIGWAGQCVSGTLVLAGYAIPESCLRTCRQIETTEPQALWGVTRLPGVFLARYLGDRTEDARRYFSLIWQALRPLYAGRMACPPRIWRT